MNASEILNRLATLQDEVTTQLGDRCPNDEWAVEFIERAVREKLERMRSATVLGSN